MYKKTTPQAGLFEEEKFTSSS